MLIVCTHLLRSFFTMTLSHAPITLSCIVFYFCTYWKWKIHIFNIYVWKREGASKKIERKGRTVLKFNMNKTKQTQYMKMCMRMWMMTQNSVNRIVYWMIQFIFYFNLTFQNGSFFFHFILTSRRNNNILIIGTEQLFIWQLDFLEFKTSSFDIWNCQLVVVWAQSILIVNIMFLNPIEVEQTLY